MKLHFALLICFVFANAHDDERLPNKCEGEAKAQTASLLDLVHWLVAAPVTSTQTHDIVVVRLCSPTLPVCKLLTAELQDALDKTGRSKEVLEVGEVLDTGKRRRKIKYNTSWVEKQNKAVFSHRKASCLPCFKVTECRETRLTEAIDDICERLLQYNVHAERPGSLRYAKVRTKKINKSI